MIKLTFFAILIFAIAAVFLLFNANRETTPVSEVKKQATEKVNSNMKIISSAFENNSKIPAKYTCDGENINPPLGFIDVPTNAKSLALIVDDPDAPMGTFVHWVLFNINPLEKEIPENSVPSSSIQGVTSAGQPGYIGPCPPSGAHRYFFKLYALDSMLNLNVNADKKAVEKTMKNHTLEEVQLVGLYNKKN